MLKHSLIASWVTLWPAHSTDKVGICFSCAARGTTRDTAERDGAHTHALEKRTARTWQVQTPHTNQKNVGTRRKSSKIRRLVPCLFSFSNGWCIPLIPVKFFAYILIPVNFGRHPSTPGGVSMSLVSPSQTWFFRASGAIFTFHTHFWAFRRILFAFVLATG